MIAYHVDRRGTLSPGQQILGTPAENLFGLPILSQWGLDEVHLLDNLPRIFDRCVKAHIDWHNMEVCAERFRQIYYQDSVSRFSCFYAVPQLDHFAFWADMIQIKPCDRIFQVHYDVPCEAYDARNLRVSAIDALFGPPADDSAYIQDIVKTERALHHYWSHTFTDSPLPELLIPLPVTIGDIVSLDSLPQL